MAPGSSVFAFTLHFANESGDRRGGVRGVEASHVQRDRMHLVLDAAAGADRRPEPWTQPLERLVRRRRIEA
jgi:hypothetical protein